MDAIVVAGGDNGFNHLFVQPDIERLADLRGRTLVADVANTGWSFVLYEILKQHGLGRGNYMIQEAGAPFRRFQAMRDDKTMAAAILNPPYAIHARHAGLKDMGPVVETIGPYLGTVPYVLRGWAEANADTLTAYLAAGIEGLRWVLDPANKAEAVKLTAERLNVPADIAAEMVSVATIPDPASPGTRHSTSKASRPCCGCAPISRAAPPRRRNNISISHSTGGPSRAFESGAKQGHTEFHEQKTSCDFQTGAGCGRRLADPGAASGRRNPLHQRLQDQGRSR